MRSHAAKSAALYGLGAFAVILGISCATSPTGRKQFILLSDAEMSQMGAQAFLEIRNKEKVEAGTPAATYIRCVAEPILRESGRGGWEVVTFSNDQANAFALPGGKIGVYTGLLKVAKTQDQLAAVLGHEVAHVLARHGAERVSHQFGAELGLAAIQSLTKENPNKQLILMGALGVAQLGVLLPFSREHETEADKMGVDLMARAGFDPQQSIELWKNMSATGGAQPPEFLSTHPSHNTRITNLRAWAPAASPSYQTAVAKGLKPNCRLPN